MVKFLTLDIKRLVQEKEIQTIENSLRILILRFLLDIWLLSKIISVHFRRQHLEVHCNSYLFNIKNASSKFWIHKML